MATYTPGITITLIASADVTGKRFVKISAADSCQTCGDGEQAVGVNLWTTSKDRPCTVIIGGTAPVEAGAAVSAGASVASDANGKAVPAGAGEYICGIAKTAASDAGDEIEVILALPATATAS